MLKRQILILWIALVFPCASFADVSHLEPYRDAQLVKSDSQDNQQIEIPLGKIRRSGRGWEPESTLRVKGSVFSSLYKISRNTELESVFSYYKSALTSQGQTVLFQCESRNCGSSNAWGNNFFQDYLLYGADDSQLLMVVQDKQDDYQIVYIIRRGAGDIMVRLDDVAAAAKQNSEFEIVAQMEVDDLPRIRRFLSDLLPDQRVVGFVTSQRKEGSSSIEQGDLYINNLIAGLGDRLSKKVRFINMADMGKEALGHDRVSFVYVTP